MSNRFLAVIVGAGCLALIPIGLRLGSSANAGAASSANLTMRAVVTSSASADPVLVDLESHNPNLNLSTARRVLSDDNGTVWQTHAKNGDICLVEHVGDSSVVASRFSCRAPADVARDGIVAGVPGHWYGIVPSAGTSVVAHVRGNASNVQVPVSGSAFRLPSDTSSVAVGDNNPDSLPTP